MLTPWTSTAAIVESRFRWFVRSAGYMLRRETKYDRRAATATPDVALRDHRFSRHPHESLAVGVNGATGTRITNWRSGSKPRNSASFCSSRRGLVGTLPVAIKARPVMTTRPLNSRSAAAMAPKRPSKAQRQLSHATSPIIASFAHCSSSAKRQTIRAARRANRNRGQPRTAGQRGLIRADAG